MKPLLVQRYYRHMIYSAQPLPRHITFHTALGSADIESSQLLFFFFLQKDLSAFLEKRALPALFIYLVIAIVFLHGVFFVQFYGKGLPQQFDSI